MAGQVDKLRFPNGAFFSMNRNEDMNNLHNMNLHQMMAMGANFSRRPRLEHTNNQLKQQERFIDMKDEEEDFVDMEDTMDKMSVTIKDEEREVEVEETEEEKRKKKQDYIKYKAQKLKEGKKKIREDWCKEQERKMREEAKKKKDEGEG